MSARNVTYRPAAQSAAAARPSSYGGWRVVFPPAVGTHNPRSRETTRVTPFAHLHIGSFANLHIGTFANYSLKFSFSAKERDTETGLSYFGARYYSSDLSVWMSVDPMSDDYPATSPYAYCRNNPISMIDEDGNEYVDFLSRLTDGPDKLPKDPNHPYVLDEVVIKAPPQTASPQSAPPVKNESKAEAIPVPIFVIIGNIFETFVINPVIAIFMSIPILFQGDTSPNQYEKLSGKNEPHGDGGRAIDKADKQIKDLEKQLQNAKNNKERQKIRKKIQNIKETAQKKKGGESHSNSNKR